jgi:hypothetical protein
MSISVSDQNSTPGTLDIPALVNDWVQRLSAKCPDLDLTALKKDLAVMVTYHIPRFRHPITAVGIAAGFYLLCLKHRFLVQNLFQDYPRYCHQWHKKIGTELGYWCEFFSPGLAMKRAGVEFTVRKIAILYPELDNRVEDVVEQAVNYPISPTAAAMLGCVDWLSRLNVKGGFLPMTEFIEEKISLSALYANWKRLSTPEYKIVTINHVGHLISESIQQAAYIAQLNQQMKAPNLKIIAIENTISHYYITFQCVCGYQFTWDCVRIALPNYCPSCTKGYFEKLKISTGIKKIKSPDANQSKFMEYECPYGHKFIKSKVTIRMNPVCPICLFLVKRREKKQRLQDFADQRGEIILASPLSKLDDVIVLCKNGHVRHTFSFLYLNNKSNCSRCQRQSKKSEPYVRKSYKTLRIQKLAECHQKAAAQGGRCLSNQILRFRESIEWECQAGHRWRARPEQILTGHWCSKCHQIKQKIDFTKKIQAIVESKGGKILSVTNVKGISMFHCICRAGHYTTMKGWAIKLGHWCPICYRTQKQKLIQSNSPHL